MSQSPCLLLPPSEAKRDGGREPSDNGFFDDPLRDSREQILQTLSSLLETKQDVDWSKILRVRGALLDRALLAASALVENRALVLPAWQRYDGVVWQHLSPGSLRDDDRRRVLIPSALYGVNRADDPIADYRLTFKASLGDLGPLANFWRTTLTSVIATYCEQKTLVNLLPGEHHQALDFEVLCKKVHVVNVNFASKDGSRAIGHEAKAAKGMFARFVLENGLDNVSKFRWSGWRTKVKDDNISLRAPK